MEMNDLSVTWASRVSSAERIAAAVSWSGGNVAGKFSLWRRYQPELIRKYVGLGMRISWRERRRLLFSAAQERASFVALHGMMPQCRDVCEALPIAKDVGHAIRHVGWNQTHYVEAGLGTRLLMMAPRGFESTLESWEFGKWKEMNAIEALDASPTVAFAAIIGDHREMPREGSIALFPSIFRIPSSPASTQSRGAIMSRRVPSPASRNAS